MDETSEELTRRAAARLAEIRMQHLKNAAIANQNLENNLKAQQSEESVSKKVEYVRNAVREGLSLSSLPEEPHPLLMCVVLAEVDLLRDILLSGKGIDINQCRESDSRTALHEACDSSSADEATCCAMAKLLLDAGADTKRRTSDFQWSAFGDAMDGAVPVAVTGGRTPLHLAAQKRMLSLCRLLVTKYGAEALVWDNDGLTPFDLWCAGINQHTETETDESSLRQREHEEDEARKLLRAEEIDEITEANRRIRRAQSHEEREAATRVHSKLSRQRISRRRVTEKERRSKEARAIVKREFDWQGLNRLIFDHPEMVLEENLFRAYQLYEQQGDFSELRKLISVPELKPYNVAVEELSKERLGDKQYCTVYGFTLFSPSFTEKLVSAIDGFRDWYQARGLYIRRGGSKYGFSFNDVGWKEFFDQLAGKYINSIARSAYSEMETKGLVRDRQYSFVVTYEPKKEERIHTHTDDSDLTVNICLGKEGFQGGDLFFYGRRSEHTKPPPTHIEESKDEEKPYWRYQHKIGQALFHFGDQYHGADEIQSGERLNLIIWCKSVK